LIDCVSDLSSVLAQ
jgi:hypothetical protein